ncbi:MAG: class I SAM-dependent methyltransferase [Candidatus Dormibacteria bacterium]
MDEHESAATAWAAALRAWRIPDEILAAAPESPWYFPPALFAADGSAPRTPTHLRVLEALPEGGSVLDVGSGGGAASLPAASRAGRIVAVDESEAMLTSFAAAAEAAGVEHREVTGVWPDVAAAAETADVVVCANVVYNVADLVPFIAALHGHAGRRVVLEASVRHPLTALVPLWNRVHPSAPRPDGPGLDDLLALLAEMGIAARVERFERDGRRAVDRAEMIRFMRRRLCVGAERDAEIDAWLGDAPAFPLGAMATVWWEVAAAGG